MLDVIMLLKLWQRVLLLELYTDGPSEHNQGPNFITILIEERKRNRAYAIAAFCARVCANAGLHTSVLHMQMKTFLFVHAFVFFRTLDASIDV